MLVLEDNLVSDYRIFNILLDTKLHKNGLKFRALHFHHVSNLNCDFLSLILIDFMVHPW